MTVTHLVVGIFDIVIGCAMLLLFVRLMFQFAGIDAKEKTLPNRCIALPELWMCLVVFFPR